MKSPEARRAHEDAEQAARLLAPVIARYNASWRNGGHPSHELLRELGVLERQARDTRAYADRLDNLDAWWRRNACQTS